jgi:hypothetical protein
VRKIVVGLVVMVGLIGVLLLLVGSDDTADAPRDAAESSAAPAAAPDPRPWREAFPLEPLPAPAATGSSAQDRQLQAALEPYRKGDYEAAASALDGFRLDHPDEPVSALYLGISRLFMDEVPNGLEILRGIPGSASAEVMAEAEWYGVVGIARLREPQAAEAEARAICARGGPAAARACAALDKLGAR